MLGQRNRDRRGGDEHVGALLLGDEREELDEIELGHRDERRPIAQGGVEQHGHAVDVEERQDGEDAIIGADAHARIDLAHVGHEVGVGEHHALGPPGGARRVRQHREVGGGIETHLRGRGRPR